jgi:hypothetical protein
MTSIRYHLFIWEGIMLTLSYRAQQRRDRAEEWEADCIGIEGLCRYTDSVLPIVATPDDVSADE